MNESNRHSNIEEYFQTQRSIYTALMTGCVIFAVTVGVLMREVELSLLEGGAALVLMIVAFAMAVGAPLLGQLFFSRQVNDTHKEDDLNDKLDTYRTASIVHWASMEGAILFCLIAAMFVAETTYVVLTVVAALLVLIPFVRARPTREHFIDKFELSPDEEQVIRYSQDFSS